MFESFFFSFKWQSVVMKWHTIIVLQLKIVPVGKSFCRLLWLVLLVKQPHRREVFISGTESPLCLSLFTVFVLFSLSLYLSFCLVLSLSLLVSLLFSKHLFYCIICVLFSMKRLRLTTHSQPESHPRKTFTFF